MKSSTPRDAVRLSPNAITVLEKRYLVKDESGAPVESPSDLFWRVARTIAQADRRYGGSEKAAEELAGEFFGLIADRLFVPNSPTLMNAGRPLGQLSACFVLPVDDALSNGKSGIYDTLRSMALVHQSGGGTGFSFSRLRPKNDIVRSTMGVASGPVSFMTLFDASTDVVKQGGTRRGANMGILRVDHPDILEFIACKDDLTQVTNFNISVAVTDAFMRAVEEGGAYDLIHPRSGQAVGQLDAREVFRKVAHGAWNTRAPGGYFIDRANHYSPVPHLGSYEATNPCGEQPLLPYDVCNLGSINVGLFARDGDVDWDRLRTAVHLCTHFLDNVIDANRYPLSEIDALAKRIRRIGLGVMGWADLLVQLGLPYNSDEAVALGRKLMEFVDEQAKVASEKQEGWYSEALMQRIAAAGHIHFDEVPATWQRVFVTAHDVTPEWHIQMQAVFQEFTDSAISKTCNFSNDATEEYVEKIYRYAYKLGCKGVTVYRDASREMQVLSTGSTAQKVKEQATGAAGEDGQRQLAEALGRVAELDAELERTRARLHDAEAENLQRRAKRSRPDLLKGATRRVETPLGTMYVNITEDDKGQPFEVFISLGKAGGALMADVEAIGRLISLALRSGIPLREVYRQLRGISSDRVVGLGPNKVLSVPDAIGIAIEKWMQEKQGVQQDLLGGAVAPVPVHVSAAEGAVSERAGEGQDFIGACPDCGSQLAFAEGCAKCHVCGFSECG